MRGKTNEKKERRNKEDGVWVVEWGNGWGEALIVEGIDRSVALSLHRSVAPSLGPCLIVFGASSLCVLLGVAMAGGRRSGQHIEKHTRNCVA